MSRLGDRRGADRGQPEAQYVPALDEEERHDAERRMPPRAAVLHEAVGAVGEEELKRAPSALTWSGRRAKCSIWRLPATSRGRKCSGITWDWCSPATSWVAR